MNSQFKLDSLLRELWPICRSVAGPGIRKSINIISNYVTFDILEIPSGSHVYDWIVPNEWELLKMRLLDSENRVIISDTDTNLHVLNYSTSFKGIISKPELLKHVYVDKENYDAIPYKTSYYRSRWGICMSQSQVDKLDDETYYLELLTRNFPGSMSIGEKFIGGLLRDEFLLSSYICHPSMANNELSGPATIAILASRLEKRRNLMSYRFSLAAETIGSIAYIHERYNHFCDFLRGGISLAMTGRDNPIVIRKTRYSSALNTVLSRYSSDIAEVAEWSPIGGGDSRQFNTIGCRFPVSYLTRCPGGKFHGYHTSHDNLERLNVASIYETVDVIMNLLFEVELEIKPSVQNDGCCEPFFSKHNLYPTLGGSKASDKTKAIKCVWGYSDGETSLRDMALKENISFTCIHDAAYSLFESGLLCCSSAVTN